jgi:cysteine desulfurase
LRFPAGERSRVLTTGNGRQRAYLDYNASAPLRVSARAAMVRRSNRGNPSSVHAEGRARGDRRGCARAVAALVGAQEPNVPCSPPARPKPHRTLLTPDWRMGRGAVRIGRICYVCAADHPCILCGGRFAPPDVTALPSTGRFVDLAPCARLAAHDKANGLPLVAVHAVPTMRPALSSLRRNRRNCARRRRRAFVLDAVQAAGRIPLDMSAGLPTI